MFSEIKKQHLIVFVLMLSLLFGGGVTYGKYLERKALPPVTVSLAEDSSKTGEGALDDDAKKEEKKAVGEVVVHVAGAVVNPGVYTLREGSRIIDAVQMAGPEKDADLNGINLAKKLTDQEMIVVPGPQGEGSGAVAQVPKVGSSSSSVSSPVVGLININTADQAQLETLPGIGPAKAAAILQYRAEKGYFSTVEDIQEVSGIGPATFNKLKDLITI